jgi:hypothetical protein
VDGAPDCVGTRVTHAGCAAPPDGFCTASPVSATAYPQSGLQHAAISTSPGLSGR